VRSVGLTGGIGAGKSTVARLLAEYGAVVVDSDAIARDVVAPSTPGLAKVVEAFGAGVLRDDGSLDREGLGRTVFSDPDARRKLEGITHPLIGAESGRLIEAARESGAPLLVHDIPLLVENGLPESFDEVIVVEAPEEVRLARLAARGLPREQALERMKAQATDEQRRAAATYLIENSGAMNDLRERVDEVWTQLTR
jgi:dephospho-CoA kinase